MASTRAGSTMDLDSQSFGVRDSDREDTNQDMNQTIIGAGLSFTKSQTSPAKGDKAKSAAAQPSPAHLFRSPLTIVTIKVGPQAFQVHKELLTKNSRYFEAAFNGSFMESKDGKMTLEEVQPADFGFYVDIVYRAHFNPGISLRKEHTGGSLSTKQILTLWSLADRFLDDVVRAMAKESLDHRLGLYSVTLWKSLARKREKDDVSGRMGRLQDAYYQCLDHDIPFEDLIVEAASNCPPQVYVDCVGMMDPEFMALVSKRLVLRQAGEEVIPRKRRAAGTD